MALFRKNTKADGERDYERFPDDQNGAVLWHMWKEGDRLIEPREVDFSAVFPSEDSALLIAILYLRKGFKVEVSEDEPNVKDDLNWRVTVYAVLVPTHTDISEIEAELIEHAQEGGGQVDGWSSVFVSPS